MIDLHTHLDLYPDALNLLSEVNSRNCFTLAVTTSPRAWEATSKVFSKYRNIYVALGLHPEIVNQKISELELFLSLVHRTRFIGEIGLDGAPNNRTSFPLQEKAFSTILNECEKDGGKIISIHSRMAATQVLKHLKNTPEAGKPILHWFTGTTKELELAIDMGCWFSVGPAMIKSRRGRELVSLMPVNSILPESDGPFATNNGRPILPWEAFSICDDLSGILGKTIDETQLIITNNLKNLLR